MISLYIELMTIIEKQNSAAVFWHLWHQRQTMYSWMNEQIVSQWMFYLVIIVYAAEAVGTQLNEQCKSTVGRNKNLDIFLHANENIFWSIKIHSARARNLLVRIYVCIET